MSSQLKSGNTQAKIQEFEESAKTTANAAHDNAADAAHAASEAGGQAQAQSHRTQEDAAGFIQQAGDQVANLAQGAIDGVKNTLGIGEKK